MQYSEIASLRPGATLVINTDEHAIGNVVSHREPDSGELLRASAYSHTEGRWINLLTESWRVKS